jgi:hypothetical protein
MYEEELENEFESKWDNVQPTTNTHNDESPTLWVIYIKSKNGKTLYMADKRLSNHYWVDNPDEAFKYRDKEMAEHKIMNFVYNNPRIKSYKKAIGEKS